ncbi:AddAB recombination complex, helicase AddA [Campylobacter sp. RM5004]|uniref:UvrD-helicase domain-containing protein n=1 Tax=Campylobacter sp. RM5004 TaxID=1660078 RepID=UPI001EFBEF28|nr:UvrD-helicase domain-containing protein [Campylobacter sp. RM5004]ULO02139.1 AddAB recombination complex, helicase AddA [Campylobacter sp. RM5004]
MKHIALSASAGSGKTFTLSIRYIALVLRGASINDIVALTFTKKAVNEMKERITNVFLNLENRAAELKVLQDSLGLSAEQIINTRNKFLKNFKEDELRIYTFDSFFSKILRLFATHEGLSVDAELIDYLDIKEEFLKSLDTNEAIKLVKDLKDFNMSLGDFLNWLESLYLNYTGEKIINDTEFISPFDEFLRLKDNFTGANKKVDEWLGKITDLNSLLSSSLLDAGKSNVQKALELPTFAAAYEELLSIVAKYYGFLESNQLKLCFNYLDKFSEVAKNYHKEQNILSFSDVAIYVHKILQNKDLKDLFYFRLNSNLSHLLIDEFQDTSVIQYEIIKPLVEEIVAGIGIDDKQKSFFYVGDKKQSIYSFRGAKQEVFDLFHKNKTYNITLQNLDTNYRSKKAIVEFVNNNFKNLYDDYYEQLVASKENGAVSKIITENYLNDVYKKIASLLQNGAKLDDICILTRDNANANEIANFLNEFGLKTNVNNNSLLVSKMSVRVLIEFAKYSLLEDEIYGYFVKSVLGKDYSKLKIDITKSAYEIYNEIITHLDLCKDEYVLEFLDDISSKDFLDTIFNLSTKLASSNEAKGINIMTIHKSKGLQFEHLICVHLSKNAPHDTGLKIEYDFSSHKWYGFKKDASAIRNLRCVYDKDYAKKLEIYENTKKNDEINTYYVAYTRAISSLCIVMNEGAGLSGINYAEITNESLDDDLLNFRYKENEASVVNISYEFNPCVPLQNVKTKEFSTDAIMLGNAFHYFCELSDFNDESLNECLRLAYNKFNQVDFDKLKKLCEDLLKCVEFKELIKNHHLVKEYNFLYENKVNRIDLLAISNDEVKIIDYKSSFFNKSYEKQLKTYENFIKTNFSNHKISSYVVFYENESFNIKRI